MLDERYLWLSAFIEHPKFNLDTRTATNSYLTKVYNNIQKVFSVCKRFYHPTAKAVGFRLTVKWQAAETEWRGRGETPGRGGLWTKDDG